MLFTKKQTINELIIGKLSVQPHQNLIQLKEAVDKQLSSPVTLQGLYKAIKGLLNDGVIVKEKKQYSLNTAWVVEALRWSRDLKTVYIDKTHEKIITLPENRQKIIYKFPDLLSMNTFWAHLLVYIGARSSKKPILYAYNPHFWFYLAHGEVEKQYNRSMQEFGVKTYMVIGSDSFLDQWNAQFFDKDRINYWLSPTAIFKDQKRYFNYIDNYFIEVKIEETKAQEIDRLFRKIQSLSEISRLELLRLFQEKSYCILAISKGTKRGESFKRKIQRYFKEIV